MKMTETFWKLFELDLAAEVRLSFLNWALSQAREPLPPRLPTVSFTTPKYLYWKDQAIEKKQRKMINR